LPNFDPSTKTHLQKKKKGKKERNRGKQTKGKIE
jgi:hypothetical protein